MIGFFEAGVICSQTNNVLRYAPNTLASNAHFITNSPPFISKGRVVPAVLGIGFGIRSGLASNFTYDDILIAITHY
jgi:hypothetical protein